MYVINVNMKIPAQKEMNRPGQNIPPNPCTTKLVASINNQVIGTPSNINAQRHSFAHGQINGPLTWIHTNICPNKNNEKEIAMYL
jgi:hypothetical protein